MQSNLASSRSLYVGTHARPHAEWFDAHFMVRVSSSLKTRFLGQCGCEAMVNGAEIGRSRSHLTATSSANDSLPIHKSDARKLPAGVCREKVSVRWPNVRSRCCHAPTYQNVLIAHEFPVVLTHRSRRRRVAGIGLVATARPLPNGSQHSSSGLRSVIRLPRGARQGLPPALQGHISR